VSTSATEAITISLVRHLCTSGRARALREAARLSLEDVAEAIGSSPSTIGNWERGIRQPRTAVALRYGEFLSALIGAGLDTVAG
jgi:transcriptional regulator with XRE-family HTH domain